jgi:hypothetical protein
LASLGSAIKIRCTVDVNARYLRKPVPESLSCGAEKESRHDRVLPGMTT